MGCGWWRDQRARSQHRHRARGDTTSSNEQQHASRGTDVARCRRGRRAACLAPGVGHYGRLMERTRREQFPPSKTGHSPAARGVLQLKHHVMFAQQRGLVPRSQCHKTRCAAVENLGTAVDDRCTTQTS